MVGYRYSTEGYRTLSQHIDDMSDESYLYGSSSSRQKSRIDLTVNQTLFRRSSLYLTAGETTYWNRPGSSRRVQFGFSSGIKRASLLAWRFPVPRRRGRSGAPIPSSRPPSASPWAVAHAPVRYMPMP